MFRLCLIALSCLLFAPGAYAGEQVRHIVTPGAWSDQPTVPDSINRRLEQAANQYELEAPVPRVVFYDIAYPADDAELAAMDGYAVMLVTAVAQDGAELPPARIYVAVKGREIALTRITGSTSTVPAAEHAADVFGTHRWDGLYLLPVYAVQDGNSAAIDFAANRKGFVFAEFTTPTREELGYSRAVTRAPKAKAPPEAALRKLVAREFPGFMQAAPPPATPQTPAKAAP